MFKGIKNRYKGNGAFYKSVLLIAVPMIVQNLITNFVNMLDNIMVGQMGTAQMSGVSIANQLMFVMNLCLFGAMSGAGIFTAQFAGNKDDKGIRHTLRYKIIIGLVIASLGIGVFTLWGTQLVSTFLTGDGTPEEAAEFLENAMAYLRVMMVGIVPFALMNAYSSTLRELGKTRVPMIAGLVAVGVNLTFNYILIFGHFGFPALGVRGAALATVLSRFVELGIVAVWTHTHTKEVPFAKGLYRGFTVPLNLVKRITLKAIPLMLNETLFSLGITMVTQCYSVRGLEVMAAINISNTLNQLMQVTTLTMGNVVGIIMGQKLGANLSKEELIDTNKKVTGFSLDMSTACAIVMIAFSGLFPKLYNTTESVRSLAVAIIIITGFLMPARAYVNCAYFTLRSGGKTLLTMLFDCCFIWAIMVPVAVVLSRFTDVHVLVIYFACQSVEIIKCIVGKIMVKRGIWINNIIS